MSNINDPFTEYLAGKGLADRTLYEYIRYYGLFKAFPFDQDGINQFLSNKKRHNSMSRSMLVALLEFLSMEDQLKLPPKPSGSKRRKIIRDLSKQQIKAIRDHTYANNTSQGFLFDLLYYGALRRSEIPPLRVNSFNWDQWFEDPEKAIELKIKLAKGNKDRVVLIPARVVKAYLEIYMKSNNIKPVDLEDLSKSLNNTSTPIFDGLTDKRIWKIIKKISKDAIGIEIRPHELRHTRATDMEKDGLDIRSIQHYLGHATPQITEIYLHTTEKQSLSKIKDLMSKQQDL